MKKIRMESFANILLQLIPLIETYSNYLKQTNKHVIERYDIFFINAQLYSTNITVISRRKAQKQQMVSCSFDELRKNKTHKLNVVFQQPISGRCFHIFFLFSYHLFHQQMLLKKTEIVSSPQ